MLSQIPCIIIIIISSSNNIKDNYVFIIYVKSVN